MGSVKRSQHRKGDYMTWHGSALFIEHQTASLKTLKRRVLRIGGGKLISLALNLSEVMTPETGATKRLGIGSFYLFLSICHELTCV